MLVRNAGFGADWLSALTLGDDPGTRVGHSTAVDQKNGRLFLFGGDGPDTDVYEAQIGWAATWKKITATGTGPSARVGAAMAWNQKLGELLVYGGDGVTDKTVWSLAIDANDNGGTWQAVTSDDAPTFLADRVPVSVTDTRDDEIGGYVWDEAGQRLILFLPPKDTGTWEAWSVDGAAWTHLFRVPSTDGKPGRTHFVLDPSGTRVIAPGGGSSAPVYSLDLNNPTKWIRLCPAGEPPSQVNGSVTATPAGVVVAGGDDVGAYTSLLDWDTPACPSP